MGIDERELARELWGVVSETKEMARHLLAKYDITPKAKAKAVWPSDEQLAEINDALCQHGGWSEARTVLLRLIAEQIDGLPNGASAGWKWIPSGVDVMASDLKAVFGIRP